jgi:2-polyprenyl-6-methoxyphenol hydroxylase-like FAD-dependent oxidoreductase
MGMTQGTICSTKGRIALIGDAAFCASLLAGQGSALAMISAYVLAGELAQAGGRYQQAFDTAAEKASSAEHGDSASVRLPPRLKFASSYRSFSLLVARDRPG